MERCCQRRSPARQGVVLVTVNPYRYREVLNQALYRRQSALPDEWDALTASWIGYALLQNGRTENPILDDTVAALVRWGTSTDILAASRFLGPFCWLGYLSPDVPSAAEVANRSFQLVPTISPGGVSHRSVRLNRCF
jgi:hypothetical protein